MDKIKEIITNIVSYLADETKNEAFDYRFLRGMIGVVAFALPILAFFKSGELFDLKSISHSYYTPAVDIFAGILFFVCAFLFAYKGHTNGENIASFLAGICALGVALFPTDEGKDETSWVGRVHLFSAIIMFAILAYFCLGSFRKSVIEKIKDAKKKELPTGAMTRRKWTYIVCGYTIVIVMVGYAILNHFAEDYVWENEILFWVEAIALFAFGIAWSVAAKYLPYLK